MNEYTISLKGNNKEDISTILSTLDKYGLAIIPNYVDIETTKNLEKEFDDILSTPDNKFKRERPYSTGKASVIDLPELKGDTLYPITQTVFTSSFMEKIAKKYMGPTVKFNHEIYVVKDIKGSKHVANDLHFDISKSLKFFLYLTDTTKENGAFSCVPGSHTISEKLRKKNEGKISHENREITRELPVEESDVVSIEGEAGTIIIFSTETFHRAGFVSTGERRVMRAHCHLPKKSKSIIKRIINKTSKFINIR